jgi:ketosteroid isomerase-like protein
MEADWTDAQQVIAAIEGANTAMLAGTSTSWREILSPAEDVVLFGAQGGYASGATEVADRFDRVAAGTYGGGGRSTSRNLGRWIGVDLAASVDLETHETTLSGSTDVVSFVYRTTHVLRREGQQWKVVLRHADPLATFRGAAFSHSEAAPVAPEPTDGAP